MTKPEPSEFAKILANIKPISGFDSQKWLRKVRAEIRRETEGMTSEQRCEYFRQAAEQGERRRAEKKKLAETACTDN